MRIWNKLLNARSRTETGKCNAPPFPPRLGLWCTGRLAFRNICVAHTTKEISCHDRNWIKRGVRSKKSFGCFVFSPTDITPHKEGDPKILCSSALLLPLENHPYSHKYYWNQNHDSVTWWQCFTSEWRIQFTPYHKLFTVIITDNSAATFCEYFYSSRNRISICIYQDGLQLSLFRGVSDVCARYFTLVKETAGEKDKEKEEEEEGEEAERCWEMGEKTKMWQGRQE